MPKKVLIAEDEELIRMAVKLTLEPDGYEIFEARDGIEALELAFRIKPDLIVLDIMMPGMNGYQVCKTLKDDPQGQNTYVLFLTARGAHQSKEAVKACGGDDILEKPFGIDILREKVRAVLGK